jgi:hypothetical protein
VPPALDRHRSIHDHVFHALRVLLRLLEGCPIRDAARVEHGDVRPLPLTQPPAVADADLVRIHARHLANGLGQGEDLQLADVAAEHAREGAVVARVRVRPAGRTVDAHRRAVGADRRPRLAHDELHVRLGVMEEHSRDAAVFFEQHVEEDVHGIPAARGDQLAHAAPLEWTIALVS